MTRLVRIGFVFVVTVCLVGCNTLSSVPRLFEAQITPTVLKPGDTAIITVVAEDAYGLIKRIEGIVKVDPPLPLALKDDGVSNAEGDEADVKAGDGIWSIRVDVSFQTPPGEFMLEFTAYGVDGRALLVRDGDGNKVPLQTYLPVVIHASDE